MERREMGRDGGGTNTSLEVVRLWNMTLLPSEAAFCALSGLKVGQV